MGLSSEQWEEVKVATVSAFVAAKANILRKPGFVKVSEVDVNYPESQFASIIGTAAFQREYTDSGENCQLSLASWEFFFNFRTQKIGTKYKIQSPAHWDLNVTRDFASGLNSHVTSACEDAGFNKIISDYWELESQRECHIIIARAFCMLYPD